MRIPGKLVYAVVIPEALLVATVAWQVDQARLREGAPPELDVAYGILVLNICKSVLIIVVLTTCTWMHRRRKLFMETQLAAAGDFSFGV